MREDIIIQIIVVAIVAIAMGIWALKIHFDLKKVGDVSVATGEGDGK